MNRRPGLDLLVFVTLLFLLSLTPGSAFAQVSEGLNETFLSSDGLFSFKYPSGWAVFEQEGGLIFLTDSEPLLLDDNREPMLSGHVFLSSCPLMRVHLLMETGI